MNNLLKLALSLCVLLLSVCIHAETLQDKMSLFTGKDVQHQLSLPVLLEYDTNPTLSSINPISIWRLSFTPRYNLITYDGVDTWNLTAGLNVQRSSNVTVSQDREDPSVNASWNREYEKGSYGLNASYYQSVSRVSQLNSGGALVFSDGTSLSKSIGANFSRNLTELTTFSLNANYQEQAFSGGVNLSNYTNQSISPKLDYILNEKLTTYLQGTYSNYKPNVGVASDFVSAVLGVDYQMNEKLNWQARAGANQVYAAQDSTGFQGGLTVKYQSTEKNFYSADYSRISSPTGLGLINTTNANTNVNTLNPNAVLQGGTTGYVQTDSLSLTANFNLSDYDNAGAAYTYSKNDDLNKLEYQQLYLWASRDLSDSWIARLSYSHKMSSTNLASADGDVLGVSITYNIVNF